MLGFRWSICLLVCLAVATSGCSGPIPWLHRRPPDNGFDEWEREYGQEEYWKGPSEAPGLEPPTLDRAPPEQEGFQRPSGVQNDGFRQADQARLDRLMDQLSSVDPATHQRLERLIAGGPTTRAYALQLLPTYLKNLTPEPAQTADAQAEVESLLKPLEVQPVATQEVWTRSAVDPAVDTRMQQEFEYIAARTAAVPTPPTLGEGPVPGVSDIHRPQYLPQVEPPPLSGRQPSDPYRTGYDPDRPYLGETPSVFPAGDSPAGIASTTDPAVTSVSHEDSTSFESNAPLSKSWREHLTSTIRAYELQLSDEPKSKAEQDAHVAAHVQLRLLYLVADDQSYAEDIPAASPDVQRFWKDELLGIDRLLDTEGYPDSSRRSSVAAGNFGSALDRLSQVSNLKVENTTFVHAVDSWGVYKPFPSTEFAPGTRVMIYAEIKNFVSDETNEGHETKLHGGYEIFASRGGPMVEHDFNVVSEVCRNQRHDYFVRYEFDLPLNVNPGKYTLRLTIKDIHDGSIAQDDVDFSIVASAP